MKKYYSNEVLVSKQNFQMKGRRSLKIRILMLFVALLGTSGLLHAQTIQIGSGTATTTNYVPINTCYGYSYSQQIYLASEILGAGATGINNQITKIRFKANNANSMINSHDWVIYLGNTTKTQFISTTDWIPTSAMTQVFSSSVGTANTIAGTWVEVTLTTPFNWNGTSNLVVAVDENTSGYDCTVDWQSYPATTDRGIYYYNDVTNPNPLTPPTANGVVNSIAQVQFDGTFMPPCTGTPTIGAISIPDSICAGIDFNLTVAATPQAGITYQWQESVAGAGIWTNTLGATSYSHNIATGIFAATDYRLIVKCSSSNQSDTSNVFTTQLFPGTECYCTPTYVYGCDSDDDIKDFILAGNAAPGINNLNTPCPLSGYADYSNLSASLTAGNTYSGNVTTNYSWGNDENVRIWIDYNKNGIFEATETISTLAGLSSTSTGAFTFTVPASVASGTYKLRVRLAYYTNPTSIDPCAMDTYGEAHDYTVIIGGGCANPVVNLGNDTIICSGTTLTLDAGNPGLTFLWNDNSTNQTLAVTSSGIYSVTVTDSTCSTTDSIEVTVQASPLVDLGNDTAFCDGTTLTLDAGNVGSEFLWNDNSTNQTLDVTTPGVYSVMVTEYGCAAEDSITVGLVGLPSGADIIFTLTDCTFHFSVENPQFIESYSWDFGDGSSIGNQATPSHTYINGDSFDVVLIITNICGDTASLTIKVSCSGVGIEDIDRSNNALKLYPNPSSDNITIENSSNLKMEYITVSNILGQVVYQNTPQSATKHQMNVSKLSAGLYTVQIKTEQGIITRKFEVLK